jgi:hypothetical protein
MEDSSFHEAIHGVEIAKCATLGDQLSFHPLLIRVVVLEGWVGCSCSSLRRHLGWDTSSVRRSGILIRKILTLSLSVQVGFHSFAFGGSFAEPLPECSSKTRMPDLWDTAINIVVSVHRYFGPFANFDTVAWILRQKGVSRLMFGSVFL